MIAIALIQPKDGNNVGGVLRACHVFRADLLELVGSRAARLINHPTNTMKSHRHVPTIITQDLVIPYDCVPVGVEVTLDAMSLPIFRHPRSAIYVFGPEDGGLGPEILKRCKIVVRIPSFRCLNLAAAVNVLLYDRLAKDERARHSGFKCGGIIFQHELPKILREGSFTIPIKTEKLRGPLL